MVQQFVRRLVPVGLIYGVVVALFWIYGPIIGEGDWNTGSFIFRVIFWGSWAAGLSMWAENRRREQGSKTPPG
jgi:type VI protein secretion system component VasK